MNSINSLIVSNYEITFLKLINEKLMLRNVFLFFHKERHSMFNAVLPSR